MKTKSELPSPLYATGINIFYLVLEIVIKSVFIMILWNIGVRNLSNHIPHISFQFCFSLLFIIALLTRLIGNALSDSLVIRAFALKQKWEEIAKYNQKFLDDNNE